ncbi:putative metabolite transport protein NicT [uncultured Defluviicoccus sp.]|uniref:Putative metabolite transport protein NicT n=1 Tax=metagenome TaxID=256318 RepID=A0A380TDL9_9ZZZZ|nr:putative metabolite transport protein NicT [uncultured Defluviicoccus sp.]
MTDPAPAVSAAPLATANEDRIYAKVFWRLVPFLMVCYTVAYLDRVNLGFAKLQMAGELGFSEAVYGLGAGIFFLGYFFFEIPSNLILQRVGARRWIARIMISWGVISALFAFTKGVTMFYVLRFLLGVAEAGFYPGVILYLTYWFPSARFAKVTAIFMSAIPLSGIFGNPLSGWIMDRTQGLAGLHGWQWMFLLEAVPAVVLGLVVWFYLTNGIREARWLTEAEKQVLERNIARNDATKAGPRSTAGAFADPRVWLLCLVYFAIVAGMYGLTFWTPTLIAATGIKGNFTVGCLSAVPYIVAVAAMIMLGRSADARRERRWHVSLPALAGAAGLVGTALAAHSTLVSLVFLSLAAAGILSCAPLFWSLPTAFLQSRGAAAGLAGINSVGNLAGFVSPVLVGFMKEATHDNRTGMFTLAAILVAGALAVLRLPRTLVNR